jgi:hypothetical protein
MDRRERMSVEEYLNYSGKPNCEYIDGVMRSKALTTSLHGLIQGSSGDRTSTVGRRCASDVIEDPYSAKPVALCVEILSPGNSLKESRKGAGTIMSWAYRIVG